MKEIKYILLCVTLMSMACVVLAQKEFVKDMPIKQHPRLLFFKKDEALMNKAILLNPEFNRVDALIKAEASAIGGLPVLERKQIGRRLLGVSREAIRRIMFTAYAFRMTGKNEFANTAEKEMLAISEFDNWNPSHFLDVAEMTMAMAIGYDWLYDFLSTSSKQKIKNAIIEKGLKPSLEARYNYWLKANHNWNQVCNGGLTFGALAVFEDDPALAKNIINRSIESIPLAMKEYGPDGAYPEGTGYWSYGTSYNVLFLSALEKIYGTDFGLSATKGFLQTADYLLHAAGSTGLSFNYSDNGAVTGLNTSVFWFAAKTKRPYLLRNELTYLDKKNNRSLADDRFLPTLLIWGKDVASYKNTIPTQNMWMAEGLSPVAFMRSSWTDKNAIFLGFKAGSADVNHAHMDIGSFVMDALGERWAMDFGAQNYESLESKGMKIFGRTQNAQRWTIFRYINPSHNTLTFNDSLQRVNGIAKIDRYSANASNMFAISDLSEVYKGEIKKSVRGAAIKNKSYVLVQDEIETLDKPAKMRWSMVTPAEVKIISAREILLTKNGKQLRMQFETSVPIQIKTWSTKPITNYDAENPGTIIIGFEAKLPANSKSDFVVKLLPGNARAANQEKIGELADW